MTQPKTPDPAEELAALRATIEQMQRDITAIKQTLTMRRGSI
ncbi:hypothetical protein [Arthrobacter sp. Soil763]|nr:hypothetical protein [Arthrobacter sp. Soil763]